MPKRTLITAVATAAVATFALAGCSGNADAPLGSPENPVQFGVVGVSEPYWEVYEAAVEEAGISIDLVDFTDYAQPNPALSEGELDINQFQHIIYLASYNVAAGNDLTPIGATAIYPLGLYSSQYDSVEEIPDGATVAVPNDDTNQARGLLVLQSAGLVTLRDGGSTTSTVADVIEEESRVSVQALDAALTVTSLPDVAAAIVNNDFLGNAGLTAEDAIATDDPSDPSAAPYINVFVTRAADKDNEVLNKLVEIYQSNDEVRAGVLEASGGTAIFATNSASELQSALATVERDVQQ